MISPKGMLLLAGYFGTCGYVFAKSGMDEKIVKAIRNAQDDMTRRQARILLDEAENRKLAVKAVNG